MVVIVVVILVWLTAAKHSLLLQLVIPQTNYIVDWLAELESHFLGHTIGIIWPMNKVYTTVT